MKINNFLGGNDVQRSPNLSNNRLVNLVPTTNDNGSVAGYYKVDGLNIEATLTGAATGAYTASNGRAFIVSGTTLFEITAPSGIITETSRGTVTAGTYSFSDNGIELICVNGTDGWIFTFSDNSLVKIRLVTGTCTISIATPAVITKVAHGLVIGDMIRFTTTGSLPSPILTHTTYYVLTAGFGVDSFRISLTLEGTAVNTEYTGTTTVTIHNYSNDGICTISIASPAVVTRTAHLLAVGDIINFSFVMTGIFDGIPAPLVIDTNYYVTSVTTDTFQFSLTAGGTPVNTTGAQGSPIIYFRNVRNNKIIKADGHSFIPGDTIKLLTTGALPTGLAVDTEYFVTGSHFGTFAIAYAGYLIYKPGIKLPVGTKLKFYTDGLLPSSMTVGTTYYVAATTGRNDLNTLGLFLSETSGSSVYLKGTINTGQIIAMEEDRFKLSTSLANIYTTTVTISGTQSGTHTYFTSSTLPFGIHTYATLGYGFPEGAKTVSYMNGRFICCEPNTQNFYVSEVLNGKFWDALNVQTVDSNPDMVIGQSVSHNELIVFCENSGETFYDSGTTPTPFIRNTTGIFEVGCAAVYSICKLDNTTFWLGKSLNGTGIVYKLAGSTPTRISTYSLEYAMQNMSVISDATAFSYQKDGHHFYVLTFPTGNKTFVYDVNTSLWHERGAVVLTSPGVLTALASPTIATETAPYDITISPDDLYVYVTNLTSATISMYSRNITTGQLTALTPATIATAQSRNIKISPDGLFVYTSNIGPDTISMYSRSLTTGLLTALTPATIATGVDPYGIAISPDGLHLYVVNSTANTMSMYSRNTTTGQLTALSPATIATGTEGRNVAISPDGLFVYVTNGTSNTVSQYSRNATTGLLTALSPASIATGTSPFGLSMSDDGLFMYVANYTGNTISQYARDAVTGKLSALTPATIAGGTGARYISVSADGTALYLSSSGSSAIYQYSRNVSSGLLAALSPATIATGTTPYALAVPSTDDNLYVINGVSNTISQYSKSTTTTSTESRWEPRNYFYFNDKHLVTDYSNTKIYSIDSSIYKNGASPIRIVRSFTAPASDMKRVAHHSVQFDLEVGLGVTNEPVIALRWSDDAGNTWNTPIERGLGLVGDYAKVVKFPRLGSTKGLPRIYEVSCDENVKITLIDAYLE